MPTPVTKSKRMAYFLLTLFRQLFNTVIHSSGDDPLLARAHRLFNKEHAQANSFTWLVPVVAGIILNLLIRYVTGHVIMSILILETAETQINSHELGKEKKVPSSRRLAHTLSTLNYQFGLHGFGAACTYWISRFAITKLLHSLILQHEYLNPIAYILSSVLLAENHFFWTARMVLAPGQMSLVSSCRDYKRWKALALPAMVHASAEALMSHVPTIMGDSSYTPYETNTLNIMSGIVLSDILLSVLMLALHVLLLLPAYILLISVEASHLPKTCETIVPSPRQRGSGLRIIELFPTAKLPLETRKAWQMIGTARILWCLELHGKMCVCLLGVTAAVRPLVYYLL